MPNKYDETEKLAARLLGIMAECQLYEVDYVTLKSYAENKWRLATGYSVMQCGRTTIDRAILDEFKTRGWA